MSCSWYASQPYEMSNHERNIRNERVRLRTYYMKRADKKVGRIVGGQSRWVAYGVVGSFYGTIFVVGTCLLESKICSMERNIGVGIVEMQTLCGTSGCCRIPGQPRAGTQRKSYGRPLMSDGRH